MTQKGFKETTKSKASLKIKYTYKNGFLNTAIEQDIDGKPYSEKNYKYTVTIKAYKQSKQVWKIRVNTISSYDKPTKYFPILMLAAEKYFGKNGQDITVKLSGKRITPKLKAIKNCN